MLRASLDLYSWVRTTMNSAAAFIDKEEQEAKDKKVATALQQTFQLNTGHGTIPQCSTCRIAAEDDPEASFPCEMCPFPLPEQYYPVYRTLIDVAEVMESPNPDNPDEPLRFLKIAPAWLSLAIQARRLSPQDFDLCLYVRRHVNAD